MEDQSPRPHHEGNAILILRLRRKTNSSSISLRHDQGPGTRPTRGPCRPEADGRRRATSEHEAMLQYQERPSANSDPIIGYYWLLLRCNNSQ